MLVSLCFLALEGLDEEVLVKAKSHCDMIMCPNYVTSLL